MAAAAAVAQTDVSEQDRIAAADPTALASELSSLALPMMTVRRIARNAAPGVSFSSEALAAMNRVAQAYILWATDRSLAHVQKEAAKQKKQKGKSGAPTTGVRRLTSENVMAFLEAELPHVASKVSNLFPDIMPAESKPVAVRLLEMYREQAAARSSTPLGAAGTDGQAGAAAAAEGAFASGEVGGARDAEQAPKRGRDDLDHAAEEVMSGPAAKKSRGKAPPSMGLTSFFSKTEGRSTTTVAAPEAVQEADRIEAKAAEADGDLEEVPSPV
eukprot:TRINITY_DN68689_c0_g1_i1.p1 TRINITY_DN68689_c0_g1~~TRINITY_DN68689_c0_g1_i1.p1  ORF type:complete len:272 (+),score=77.26 TRINITY_DN68689_c0_g1_i1:49-864(+)